MTGALRRAAKAAAVGLSTMAILVMATTVAYQTTPMALVAEYWFIYLPALAMPPLVIFGHAALNNWMAGGDPQQEI